MIPLPRAWAISVTLARLSCARPVSTEMAPIAATAVTARAINKLDSDAPGFISRDAEKTKNGRDNGRSAPQDTDRRRRSSAAHATPHSLVNSLLPLGFGCLT